jgi:methionine-rich copper-binding protein CopC
MRRLACIVFGGLLPLAALAHAKLLNTVPAAGEQLAVAPRQMTLKFNEAVQIGVLKVSSADGKNIPIDLDHGALAAPAAPAATSAPSTVATSKAAASGASTVTVALPVLGPGTYQVQWSALTVDDGHVVKGTFSFVVTGAH